MFMGTPQFAVPSLQALLCSQHEVCGVVTQPDRPSGRGQRLAPPPVKQLAEQHGLPVLQPERANASVERGVILGLAPDLIVVAAYGQILRREYLVRPRYGAINLHASLLPRHRGSSPASAAILAGDQVTGVTIQRMAARMDAGPILRIAETPVGDDETASELEARLAELGASLLPETIHEIERGTASEQPQDEALATTAPKLAKGDGLIDWTQPAEYLARFIRAMTDWPGAFTFWLSPERGPVRLVIRRARACESGAESPGTVLLVGDAELAVATGRGALSVVELQPAGKRAMPTADFLRGHDLQPGQLLGMF